MNIRYPIYEGVYRILTKERGIKGNRQRSCGNLQTGIVPFTDDVVIGTIPYHSLFCQNRYLKGRNAANRPSFVLAKYKTL